MPELYSPKQQHSTMDIPLSQKPGSLVFPVIIMIGVALMMAFLIFITVVGLSVVRQNSMAPTLQDGNHITMWNIPRRIRRNHIVVVNAPLSHQIEGQPRPLFVKRVVATGGDIVRFTLNRDNIITQSGFTGHEVFLYLSLAGNYDANGNRIFIRQQEDFILEPMVDSSNHFNRIRPYLLLYGYWDYYVPAGNLFLLGDNRNNSVDSRAYDSWHVSDVVGRKIRRLTPDSFLERLFLFIY